jgi:hypothetical protein
MPNLMGRKGKGRSSWASKLNDKYVGRILFLKASDSFQPATVSLSCLQRLFPSFRFLEKHPVLFVYRNDLTSVRYLL